uniref:Uncharacterized protein n=1 Tax=Ciona savignyi TaxID=51511 RepID=H2YL15_CIOSA
MNLRRKNYIKSTDSDYVKLSKQGGAKDLLSISENVRSDVAVDYPKSDWFGHRSLNEENENQMSAGWKAPDYMVHSEDKGKASRPAAQGAADEGAPRALTAREERILIQAKYNGTAAPFQSDNLSFWERKDEPPLRSRRHK